MIGDRRSEPRKSADLILNAYQDGIPALVQCRDLSLSGMRLRRVLGPRKIRSGFIDLEFQLPNDPEVLKVRGQPVYERNDGEVVGVRFHRLTESQARKVRAFVEETPRFRPIFDA
jgi:c-di-GMP-binding flagellar brake protein YcgR